MSDNPTNVVTDTGKRKPPAAGKGRPKGSVNKVTSDIRSAIHEAFELAGGVGYLVRLASTDPKTFIPLLAKIVPAEVKTQISGNLDFTKIVREIVDLPKNPDT